MSFFDTGDRPKRPRFARSQSDDSDSDSAAFPRPFLQNRLDFASSNGNDEGSDKSSSDQEFPQEQTGRPKRKLADTGFFKSSLHSKSVKPRASVAGSSSSADLQREERMPPPPKAHSTEARGGLQSVQVSEDERSQPQQHMVSRAAQEVAAAEPRPRPQDAEEDHRGHQEDINITSQCSELDSKAAAVRIRLQQLKQQLLPVRAQLIARRVSLSEMLCRFGESNDSALEGELAALRGELEAVRLRRQPA